MQQANLQAYVFQEYESYGHRLLKGITRDQTFNQLLKYPLLVKYYKKNDLEIQNRIIDTLMREPSQSDCPGFIYGFKDYNEHKQNPHADKFQIKMGRTKRQVPQDRIYEWEHQDGHQYVELFTIRSQHNNKLQSLVHLFFAYARRTKYINGKRRIEWFTFDQKALNAAVTAMINELMEKVHEMATVNESTPPTVSFDLGNFLQSVTEEVLNAAFVIKRLLIFGPKESGKSTVKAMLDGQEINAIKAEPKEGDLFVATQKLQLILPEARDPYKNVYELNLPTQTLRTAEEINQADSLKNLKRSLLTWHYVNNVEQLAIPCFIITENDLLSSQILAFRTSLKNFLSFIKYSGDNLIQDQSENRQNFFRPQQGEKALKSLSDFKLYMVITKILSTHKYSEQKLKEFFLSKKQYFEPQEITILLNASIGFTYQAQTEGSHIYNIEKFINDIKQLDQNKFKSVSFQFSDPSILKICEEIQHFGYDDLGLMFFDYFKAGLRKIIKASEAQQMMNDLELNEESKKTNQDTEIKEAFGSLKLVEDKMTFIEKVIKLVIQIKRSKKQQQIVLNLKKLQLLFEFSQSDQVFSQLLVFCECMIKTGSQHLVQEIEDQSTLKKDSRIWSPAYLSNSLIFSRMLQKIEQTKEEIRSEMNSIVDTQVKQTFLRVTKRVYDELFKRPAGQRNLFEQFYNILFGLMNIHETVESYRVEKKLSRQDVSDQRLEQQVLVKSLNDLHNILAVDSRSDKHQEYKSVSEIINIIDSISRRHKIRTNSIVSRIKEAIYLATKETKLIPMIDSHSHSNQSQDTTGNSINGVNANKNKKTYPNRNNTNVIVNGQVKMILNKKNQQKNQRLLNYINSKKKNTQLNRLSQRNGSQQILPAQQQKPEQLYPELKPERTHSYETRNNSKPPNRINSINKKKEFIQSLELPEQQNEEVAEISNEEFYSVIKKIEKKVQQISEDDEFYSIDEGDSQEQKNLKDNFTNDLSLMSQEVSNMTILEGDDINENYLSFVTQLNSQTSSVAKSAFSLTLLKDLYTHALFSIEQQKRYNDIVFNYSQGSFDIDLPSIVFHNAFVVIFAKSIIVDPFKHFDQCNMNFKVHYKSRKPTKIHVILVAQNFNGLEKLKIEENRLAKLLMVQVTRQSETKFKVLDGYYTKNKRNEKKLANLLVSELVQAFVQMIK